jgi:hypothetical protein
MSNRAKARFPLPREAGSVIDGKEAAPTRGLKTYLDSTEELLTESP